MSDPDHRGAERGAQIPLGGLATHAIPKQPKSLGVLGTSLRATNYADLTAELQVLSRQSRTFVVDFTNTQIVTLRRHQPHFRQITERFDYFIPDGMPLIWCLNAQGAKLRDRVYGPTFMRHCVLASPAPFTHYFLGGSNECLVRLKEAFLKEDPAVQIVGCHDGYFGPETEADILKEVRQLSPNFIWVGLGTPKQQSWIQRNRDHLPRGILLAVGFAFDVNAGMKPDAPLWMQQLGLTWVFRLLSEPRRLGFRYLRYNSLFLFYLFWDGLRRRAWLLER